VYSQKIQPLLAPMTNSAIASRIGVSKAFAGRIRRGYRPHPRHWLALAELVGAFGSCVKAPNYRIDDDPITPRPIHTTSRQLAESRLH